MISGKRFNILHVGYVLSGVGFFPLFFFANYCMVDSCGRDYLFFSFFLFFFVICLFVCFLFYFVLFSFCFLLFLLIFWWGLNNVIPDSIRDF
jgi:hypothetical protein